jgi:hypothetical protein
MNMHAVLVPILLNVLKNQLVSISNPGEYHRFPHPYIGQEMKKREHTDNRWTTNTLLANRTIICETLFTISVRCRKIYSAPDK